MAYTDDIMSFRLGDSCSYVRTCDHGLLYAPNMYKALFLEKSRGHLITPDVLICINTVTAEIS